MKKTPTVKKKIEWSPFVLLILFLFLIGLNVFLKMSLDDLKELTDHRFDSVYENMGERINNSLQSLYIPYGQTTRVWTSLDDGGTTTFSTYRETICPQDAIQLILDHLGLELEKTKGEESKVILKKKKGK